MDVSNDPTPHETNNGNKNNTDMVEVTPDEIDETNSLETANDPENNGATPQETNDVDPNTDKIGVKMKMMQRVRKLLMTWFL